MERLTKEQQKQRVLYANTIFAKAPSTVVQAYLSALATAPDHVPVPDWAEGIRAAERNRKLTDEERQSIILNTRLELASLSADMERYKL